MISVRRSTIYTLLDSAEHGPAMRDKQIEVLDTALAPLVADIDAATVISVCKIIHKRGYLLPKTLAALAPRALEIVKAWRQRTQTPIPQQLISTFVLKCPETTSLLLVKSLPISDRVVISALERWGQHAISAIMQNPFYHLGKATKHYISTHVEQHPHLAILFLTDLRTGPKQFVEAFLELAPLKQITLLNQMDWDKLRWHEVPLNFVDVCPSLTDHQWAKVRNAALRGDKEKTAFEICAATKLQLQDPSSLICSQSRIFTLAILKAMDCPTEYLLAITPLFSSTQAREANIEFSKLPRQGTTCLAKIALIVARQKQKIEFEPHEAAPETPIEADNQGIHALKGSQLDKARRPSAA